MDRIIGKILIIIVIWLVGNLPPPPCVSDYGPFPDWWIHSQSCSVAMVCKGLQRQPTVTTSSWPMNNPLTKVTVISSHHSPFSIQSEIVPFCIWAFGATKPKFSHLKCTMLALSVQPDDRRLDNKKRKSTQNQLQMENREPWGLQMGGDEASEVRDKSRAFIKCMNSRCFFGWIFMATAQLKRQLRIAVCHLEFVAIDAQCASERFVSRSLSIIRKATQRTDVWLDRMGCAVSGDSPGRRHRQSLHHNNNTIGSLLRRRRRTQAWSRPIFRTEETQWDTQSTKAHMHVQCSSTQRAQTNADCKMFVVWRSIRFTMTEWVRCDAPLLPMRQDYKIQQWQQQQNISQERSKQQNDTLRRWWKERGKNTYIYISEQINKPVDVRFDSICICLSLFFSLVLVPLPLLVLCAYLLAAAALPRAMNFA